MWISVVTGSADGPDLLLPDGAWPASCGQATLHYGAASLKVTVGTAPACGDGSREHPAQVAAAPALIDRLHVRTEPVYQLQTGGGRIAIGPVLGLLLGNRTQWYDDSYLRREPERVAAVYRETGGLFCAFSPRTYSQAEGCAYGLYYDPGEGRWRYGTLPMPAVLHRRSFHADPELVERVRAGGPILFNSRRYSKWELYQLLRKDAALRAHLPDTVAIKEGAEVFSLLRRHAAVVLKPADLSRGRGIWFAERQGRRYRLLDCRTPGVVEERLLAKAELQALITAELAGRRYLAQQRIALAAIGEALFDIRVVMQRTPGGQWSDHAIECRLSGSGQLVTNIAHGGSALWLADAVVAAFGGTVQVGEVEAKALEIAHRLCRLLDETGEHFGEWGIDLALDRGGHLWIIEANVIPTFKGFAALDGALHRRLLAAPMRYAAALAGFGGK